MDGFFSELWKILRLFGFSEDRDAKFPGLQVMMKGVSIGISPACVCEVDQPSMVGSLIEGVLKNFLVHL